MKQNVHKRVHFDDKAIFMHINQINVPKWGKNY